MGRLFVLGPHAGALFDAESVLLIDDHKTQIAELHTVFDQGMRTHKQLHVARSDPPQCGLPFTGLRGAGKDRHAHGQAFEQAGQGGIMLAGKDFGRGHHAGLKAVVNGQQHRQQGHKGLSRSHIALQQPVHLVSRDGILPDLADDTLLRLRKGEGQFLPIERIEHLTHMREEETVVFREPGCTTGKDIELHAEQLFEFQPVLCLPERLGRLREMDVVQCVM